MGMVWVAAGIAVAVWAMVSYNRLVRLRNLVRAGWADIDVQLMRRHDLVPMLVEAVLGYATHEKTTRHSVTALRGQARRVRGLASHPKLSWRHERVPKVIVGDGALALDVEDAWTAKFTAAVGASAAAAAAGAMHWYQVQRRGHAAIAPGR